MSVAAGRPLLFDTSAVVSLVERASTPAATMIRESGERPFVSFVTIAELHVGVAASADDETRDHRRRTLALATTFRQLPLGPEILDHYAAVRLARIRGNDAWIAASARQLTATLITADEVLAGRAVELVDVTLLHA